MRMHIPFAALGLALVAGAPAANAQTVITGQIVDQPVETIVTQPVQTVRTVETVRTVRPAARTAARPFVRRQVVTTRTTRTTRQIVMRQRVIPTQTVVARTAAYPQPLYDQVGPASVATGPAYRQPFYDDEVVRAPVAAYPRPLYDAVMPAPFAGPVADEAVYNAAPAATAPGFYRYVYEPNRILVIDPNTNIAVEAIPR